MSNNSPPPKYRAIYEVMCKKYGTGRQATDDIIQCIPFRMLDDKGYRHTIIIYKLIAFARQQWLHIRRLPALFHYTHSGQ